jgi:hypothetical protein
MKSMIALLLYCALGYAIDTARVAYTQEAITLDGVLDEPAWARADTLHDFQFPWGVTYGQQSQAKLLWDDSAFYVGVIMLDSNLIATVTSGTSIDGDEMFEMHMSPDAVNPFYFYILECNPNKVFRSRIRHALQSGRNGWYEVWNISQTQTSVKFNGLKNNATGKDTSWVLEMRVPFSSVAGWQATAHTAPAGWAPAAPPAIGSIWLYNLTRQDVNVYNDPSADLSCWSYNNNHAYGADTIQFHDPNNFGAIVFQGSVAVEVAAQSAIDFNIEVAPNPFHPQVTFRFGHAPSKVAVYDVSGKLIHQWREGRLSRQMRWDAWGQTPGIYLVKAQVGKMTYWKKITLMR